ncbi:hypothetical protein MKQ68_21230 [Chitinophaga horti]|uniref:Two component regulator three Y domain-containing protein n=1 Tax=Chitinophaga horti TaxID=2920382 RepID=A0ABY6IZA0_9BACT|nr:two-component regulator propeller domain-containing protein [Chitinophaga horti]UYQ92608.1 hypothetical protein MKQ68_21230 [Chitinophaga horti]
MKRLPLLLFLFVLASDVFAQQAGQYVFERLTTANGLSSNIIQAIVQDVRGYIWLASNNGLQRYDGNRFITFNHQPGNLHPFENDFVGFVYEDARHRLWVGTGDNKVGIFDTRTFKFKEVPVKWRMNNTIFIIKRLTDVQGNLVMTTIDNGVYLYDSVRNVFNQSEDFLKVPKGWRPNTIVDDKKDGKLWMSCAEGLVMYDPKTNNINYRGHNPDKNPFITRFAENKHTHWLHLDQHRRLSFVTWEPDKPGPWVCVFDLASNNSKNYSLAKEIGLGYHEVFGPMEQRNGRLWFHGLPFLAEYTGDSTQPFIPIRNEYLTEQSIRFDRVERVYEDREQNLWVATDNGLYLFNPDAEVFKNMYPQRYGEKPAEAAIQAICKASDGLVWIGSWGGGLYFYDKDMNPAPAPEGLDGSNAHMIWHILEQKDKQRMWIGMQAGELLVYDRATKKGQYFRPPEIKGSTIREMVEDRDGNIWFGTQSGYIVKWDKKASGGDATKGFTLVMREGLVHEMYCDREGFLWIGSMGYGCFRMDPRTHKILNRYHTEAEPGRRLYENTPQDILQYDDTTFIVSTGAINIINTRTGAIRILSTQHGLPSNSVYEMEKDQQGDVWLGLANGLCRFNVEKDIFTLFDRRDGIRHDNFSSIGSARMADGSLIFTTDHNFVMFDPARMRQRAAPRDAVITLFGLENHPLLVDSLMQLDQVVLPHDRTSITIGFSALTYLNQQKLAYYYQLEGQDKEWIRADGRQQAIYNYLPPGRYVFKVKTQNGDGLFSEEEAMLNIYVKAPFWRTWWFYGALALLFTGILYWIDRERIKRILGLQKMRSQIAGNLHTAVNTTLNNINLLSEMAKIKADKDVSLSKEYIEQISEKSREMIDAMDDVLWSIQPENDSMQKTLLRINEFSDGLQSSHGVTVKMEVDNKVTGLTLDMKIRQDIYFLYKDALSYIVQYAEGTTVLVNMDLVKSRFLLKIHAPGPFTVVEAAADARYFEAMQQRAAQLPALLDIQTDKRGIAVILQVPVR